MFSFWINTLQLLKKLIKWFTEMTLVTASIVILHWDWFEIWSWLNYSWILYSHVSGIDSLCSVVPMLAGSSFYVLQFYINVLMFLQCSQTLSYSIWCLFLQLCGLFNSFHMHSLFSLHCGKWREDSAIWSKWMENVKCIKLQMQVIHIHTNGYSMTML